MPLLPRLRRFRALLVVILGSLVCAGLGYAAALTMAPSRSEDAAAAPTGPVTAPVELRRLGSSVITRGDAGFSDPVELVVRTAVPLPIVTRAPLARGGTVAAGQVVLEVAGRPVIALAGSLPAYRDLAVGDLGPDVAQLEQALASLGLDPGEVDDHLTESTAAAVDDLYERLGYSPASESETPPTSTDADGATPDAPSSQESEVVLPMSEVSYVPTLPRRVDRAQARRGEQLPKVPILLSGSELVISIGLTAADKEVLHQGMRAVVTVPGARTVAGRLGRVTATATGARTSVRLPHLTAEQEEALEGANVKVTVPLEATDGKVLVVPLAALSTDAAGTVRVVRVATDGTTETVEVEVGLSAQGLAEVRSLDGSLDVGDRVVIGA